MTYKYKFHCVREHTHLCFYTHYVTGNLYKEEEEEETKRGKEKEIRVGKREKEVSYISFHCNNRHFAMVSEVAYSQVCV